MTTWRSIFLPVCAVLLLLWAPCGFAADVSTKVVDASANAVIASTNAASLVTPPTLPSAGPSMLRVFGALLFVIGLFLGGAWLFRNARQLRFNRGTAPRLRVLESRSLGGRHALFVVAYQDETLLLSSSPAGINLLTHLPSSPESAEEPNSPSVPGASFAQALAGKLLLAGKPGGKSA